MNPRAICFFWLCVLDYIDLDAFGGEPIRLLLWSGLWVGDTADR